MMMMMNYRQHTLCLMKKRKMRSSSKRSLTFRNLKESLPKREVNRRNLIRRNKRSPQRARNLKSSFPANEFVASQTLPILTKTRKRSCKKQRASHSLI